MMVADADENAPTVQEADRAFLVPTVDRDDYTDFLFDVCRREGVDLVVPLNDFELPVLAAARHRFEQAGITVVVSSSEVISTCFDKWKTIRFAAAQGIRTPRTFLTLAEAVGAIRSGELAFPLVVKPRWGTASLGIDYVEDERELHLAYELGAKRLWRTVLARASSDDIEHSLLIQQRLVGGEYGLDVVNDLRGRHVCAWVKRKLGMRAGETDRAVTAVHEGVEALGTAVGRALGHIANLDCDVFVMDGLCYLLEMNPRFGGGYPFSHMAGANLPAALIAWATNGEVSADWLTLTPGVTGAKCDRVVARRSACGERRVG